MDSRYNPQNYYNHGKGNGIVNGNGNGNGGGKTTTSQLTNKHEMLSVVIPLLSAEHALRTLKYKPNLSGNISDRPILASFIGNMNTHPIRSRLQKILPKGDGIIIESGKYTEEEDSERFEDLMSKSIFALCPRGVGSTSFRLAEAMEYGCIPVYISDTFSLPFEKKINWDNVIVKVHVSEINNLYKLLKSKASQPQWLMAKQQNVIKIYNEFFKMDKCADTILSIVTKTIKD